MNSFRTGEMDPAFFGLAGTEPYASAATCLLNKIVRPAGYIDKRPGTSYISEAPGNQRSRFLHLRRDRTLVVPDVQNYDSTIWDFRANPTTLTDTASVFGYAPYRQQRVALVPGATIVSRGLTYANLPFFDVIPYKSGAILITKGFVPFQYNGTAFVSIPLTFPAATPALLTAIEGATVHENRLVLAQRAGDGRLRLSFSKAGFYTDFTAVDPSNKVPTDGFVTHLEHSEDAKVSWVASMGHILIVATNRELFEVYGQGAQRYISAIEPPITRTLRDLGASRVRPANYDNDLLYVAADNRTIHLLYFVKGRGGSSVNELVIDLPINTFKNYSIPSADIIRVNIYSGPEPMLVALMESGDVLSLQRQGSEEDTAYAVCRWSFEGKCSDILNNEFDNRNYEDLILCLGRPFLGSKKYFIERLRHYDNRPAPTDFIHYVAEDLREYHIRAKDDLRHRLATEIYTDHAFSVDVHNYVDATSLLNFTLTDGVSRGVLTSSPLPSPTTPSPLNFFPVDAEKYGMRIVDLSTGRGYFVEKVIDSRNAEVLSYPELEHGLPMSDTAMNPGSYEVQTKSVGGMPEMFGEGMFTVLIDGVNVQKSVISEFVTNSASCIDPNGKVSLYFDASGNVRRQENVDRYEDITLSAWGRRFIVGIDYLDLLLTTPLSKGLDEDSVTKRGIREVTIYSSYSPAFQIGSTLERLEYIIFPHKGVSFTGENSPGRDEVSSSIGEYIEISKSDLIRSTVTRTPSLFVCYNGPYKTSIGAVIALSDN